MKQNNHFEKLEFKQWKKLYFTSMDIIWEECIECNGVGYTECCECSQEIECEECYGKGGRDIEKESGLPLKQYYDNQRDKDNKLVDIFVNGNY